MHEKRLVFNEQRLIERIATAEERPWALLTRQAPDAVDASIGPKELRDHFQPLLFKETARPQLALVVPEPWHKRPFTVGEVVDVMCTAKSNRAPGTDIITNEQLKGSLLVLASYWTCLFNACLEKGQVPSSWKSSDMFILYKGKGPASNLDNYRGIALQSNPFKLLTKLVKERLEHELDSHLSESQHGFRKGRSTEGPLQRVIYEVSVRLQAKRQFVYAAFVDFKKAFDSVDRCLLLECLRKRFNVGGHIFELIKALMSLNTVTIRNGLTDSGPITQSVGVVQGDSLSPYLFILFIDDLNEALANEANVQLHLYADDLLVTATTTEELQKALDKLHQWALAKKLEVNVSKSKVMKFRRGGGYSSKDFFTFGDERLDIATEYRYLGVTLQPTLCFTKHVKNVKSRAIAATSSIKNLQSLSVRAGLSLFNLKVFPVLSYGLKSIAGRLSAANLLDMDVALSLFLKKLLALPRHASATLAHELAGVPFLVEGLLLDLPLSPAAVEKYRASVSERRQRFRAAKYTEGPAFRCDEWKGSMQKNRHWITSFTAHGFHHLWCTDADFHDVGPGCMCAYCGDEVQGRYHALDCPFIPPNLSLSQIHSLLS